MLKQLSRFERTSKVLILGFVALMAVSLVLFFRPNSGSSALEPTRSTEVLANVNGAEISVGDVGIFERGVAEDVAREKLEAFVAASVRISEDEVQQEYKRKNTNFDITYVVVSADKLAEKIQPTDDELKAYFDKHKSDYNISVPQKKIKYIFVDQDKSGQKLQISDKE